MIQKIYLVVVTSAPGNVLHSGCYNQLISTKMNEDFSFINTEINRERREKDHKERKREGEREREQNMEMMR